MSNNLSVSFAKHPSDIVLTLHDRGKPRPATADQPHRSFDLKEIQRRAFDRGIQVERERNGKNIVSSLAELVESLSTQVEKRKFDSKKVEEFAVRLGITIAERLTHTTLAAGEHDTQKMVQELLAELKSEKDFECVEIALHPDDHALILEARSEGMVAADQVEFVADPTLAVGDFRVNTDSSEYYALINERLEALRMTLIEEARHVSS